MDRPGIIYRAKNILTCECYIGQTIQTITKRKQIHEREASNYKHPNKYFHNALRKYGQQNFKWEIMSYCKNKFQRDMMEIFYIGYYRINGGVYNLTDGGDGSVGYKATEETRKKQSENMLGRVYGEEHRKNISRGRTGIIFTEKHCKNISKSHLGVSTAGRMSVEARKAMSDRQKGSNNVAKRQAVKEKISESISAEKHPNYGKHLSDETKQKISKAHKGMKASEEARKKMSESQQKRHSKKVSTDG